MKIICKKKLTGRPSKKEIKELKDRYSQFYNSHYEQLYKMKIRLYLYVYNFRLSNGEQYIDKIKDYS